MTSVWKQSGKKVSEQMTWAHNFGYSITRDFVFMQVTHNCWDSEEQEVVMGWTCGLGGRKGVHTKFWWGNLRGNFHLEGREGDRKITLILFLGGNKLWGSVINGRNQVRVEGRTPVSGSVVSTNCSKTFQCQILWKYVQHFPSCYRRIDRQTDKAN
jgi:hypothetical protein